MHLLLKDVLRDNNLLAIACSFDLVSLNFLDLKVAGPGEPVANRKVLYVPESTISTLLLLLFSFLLAALLEDILNVLEDDVLDGPVVDLAELVVCLGSQVDDCAAAKVVFNIDKMASHGGETTLGNFLGKLGNFLLVLQVFEACGL